MPASINARAHGNRLAMNHNTPVTTARGQDAVAARAALTTFAVLCALATPMLRAPVFAGAADPAGPNPVTLGEKIFGDASLSASGAMSCATCHDPKFAHAQSNDLSVQFGGAESRRAWFSRRPVAAVPQPHARFQLRRPTARRRVASTATAAPRSAGAGAAPAVRSARDGQRHTCRPGRASGRAPLTPTSSARCSATTSSTTNRARCSP